MYGSMASLCVRNRRLNSSEDKMFPKKLIKKVKEILQCFHRSELEPVKVLKLLQAEGVSPACLRQAQLEDEVRWIARFRLEFESDCVPSWRENPSEDDFFE